MRPKNHPSSTWTIQTSKRSVLNFRLGPNSANKYVNFLSPMDSAAQPGLRPQALKHGAFPRDSQTIESIRLCFQNGL